MDPFTQRMLDRARARQEKIDQKLANSGQSVPKRRPLAENVAPIKTDIISKSPIKPVKDQAPSPRRSSRLSKEPAKASPVKTPSKKISKVDDKAFSPRSDVVVTNSKFGSPSRGVQRRNSDVSVEINIMHRDDIQIEVQVEEREVPITCNDSTSGKGSSVTVQEVHEDPSKKALDKQLAEMEHRSGLRQNVKSRLDRLGVLYSDKPTLSSPIHRTEQDFSSATPPPAYLKVDTPRPALGDGRRKYGRLAALADQINNWEDDLTHHGNQAETTKKPTKGSPAADNDSSTLDVSIHSINDINKVLKTAKAKETPRSVNTRTYSRTNQSPKQTLDKKIVAQLEGEGYRRISAGQSRLVYDFAPTKTDPDRQEPKGASTTPSASGARNMATLVASNKPPVIAKKPSIKKYKAPTPPAKNVTNDDESGDSDKDKENNVVDREENDNDAIDCKQTKDEPAEKLADKASPVVKRAAVKLNGNVDRNSVLSKAAMFEAGSPKTKEKDPAEMSLRERKALFEKNKGVAIIPKAPFGQAPSVKTLLGDKASPKTNRQIQPKTKKPNLSESSRNNSKESLRDDNQPIVGIKGKLQALFNKEQTISESSISNKLKLERDREMEMLQNRFHYKPSNPTNQDSDADQSDHDPSEDAPLMGSSISLHQPSRNPVIVANVPKDKTRSEMALNLRDEGDIVAVQPNKRRSSNDSPVVLSVLEDVKRIKVNDKKEVANGVASKNLYPHLSDIETDHSNTNEEFSECGGSSIEMNDDKLNKSDNWAETSFGREVMNIVKRNNSSYKKAVASDSESSCADGDLDEMLDEALNEEDSEGPTPPKQNKHGNSLSSKSFVYEQGSPLKKHFKSPLKLEPVTPKPDRGNELVHTVSFYRRMQSASSTPTTPCRVVRHHSPTRATPGAAEDVTAAVTTVRERITELQAEIAKQQTVISQASQALNLCAATVEFSGSTEQAEGERLLLLATHRLRAALGEVQRLQVEGAGAGGRAGGATLSLARLTLPLRRDYIRRLNAEGAVGHQCVLLVKCRDRVLATSMQQSGANTTSLVFPDEIRMDGLHADFKVTVEVYLLQASKEVLPHDVKYHITKKSSSKLLTPKSKSKSELKSVKIQSPGGPLSVRSPAFQPHGYCIFALQQANRTSFTLSKLPVNSPLEGSLQVQIQASLKIPAPGPHAAFLTAFDDVSGLGAWHRRWCVLQAPVLSYWKYPDDVNKKMPIGDINLSTVLSEKVVRAPRDLCARPNTLLLETSVPQGLIIPDSGSLVYVRREDGTVVRRHLLAADTPQDRDTWLEVLNKALEYVRCCVRDD